MALLNSVSISLHFSILPFLQLNNFVGFLDFPDQIAHERFTTEMERGFVRAPRRPPVAQMEESTIGDDCHKARMIMYPQDPLNVIHYVQMGSRIK